VKSPLTTTLAVELRAFFSEHLHQTRGLSRHTVLSYRDAFVLFLRFLATRNDCSVVDLDLEHLTSKSLISFLDHLEADRGNVVASRNARLAAVHSFVRFIATRHPDFLENCQKLLAVPIKRFRVRTIDYLEGREIAAMLAGVDTQQPEGQRDYAMILTLFNTGARVQELLDIRPMDLQLERPFSVRLLGKGRKERICPLWDNTVDSLRPLLPPAGENGSRAIPIFLNRRREPITRFGVAYILRKHATRAQDAVPLLKNKKMHPHVFRHSTAVHLLQAGVDLITISHWLGHASVETTNRYAVIDLETKRKALELAGPLELKTDDVDKKWKSDPSILKWLETL